MHVHIPNALFIRDEQILISVLVLIQVVLIGNN